MRSVSLEHVRNHLRAESLLRVRFALGAVACACASAITLDAHAETPPPEVGYNYNVIETPRITAMNDAVHALSNSTEALFTNPANMSVSRVYHLTALAQVWPESHRQSYGIAAVDSV